MLRETYTYYAVKIAPCIGGACVKLWRVVFSGSMNSRWEVRRSVTGRGLFARESFRKGVCVIEYTGIKIPTPLADALTTRYLFDLENGWTIDGAAFGNTARYVNHSCNPNCEAIIEGEQIFFYAVRRIETGEELTIDYGKEYFDEFIKPTGCLCSPCREKEKPLAYASGSRSSTRE